MCGGVGLGGEYSVVKGIAILIELEVNLIVMVVAVPYGGQVLEWNQNYNLVSEVHLFFSRTSSNRVIPSKGTPSGDGGDDGDNDDDDDEKSVTVSFWNVCRCYL